MKRKIRIIIMSCVCIHQFIDKVGYLTRRRKYFVVIHIMETRVSGWNMVDLFLVYFMD